MKLVRPPPDLFPCPECHYLLQEVEGAPHGLAWHGCGAWPAKAKADLLDDEGEDVDGVPRAVALALEAANDPDLTPQKAAMAYARVMLFSMAMGREVVGAPGDVFAGFGKFAETTGGGDSGMKEFLAMLNDDDG